MIRLSGPSIMLVGRETIMTMWLRKRKKKFTDLNLYNLVEFELFILNELFKLELSYDIQYL